MSYNGIEVFFQNLGNADSLYVRHWVNGIPTNILVDGGRKTHNEQVEKFLTERSNDAPECTTTIHHLICTHSDDDHVGGLVPLVENGNFPIQKAWVHDLRGTEFLPDGYAAQLRAWGATKLLEKIEASEQTRLAFITALENHRIVHEDPFAGVQIGPMIVGGPRVDFYRDQYSKMLQEDTAKGFNSALVSNSVERFLTETMLKTAEASKELGDGVTTPINEVSTIILLPYGNDTNPDIYLFTGDVGPQGLDQVIDAVPDLLESVKWLDTPHHGSRRSMRQDQIDHIAPKTSFISAKGSVKHPSRKMVNALKKHGKVFSTDYLASSQNWLRHSAGAVPNVSTTPATPLYDKE